MFDEAKEAALREAAKRARNDEFKHLHWEWLNARAALHTPNWPNDDEAGGALIDKSIAAQRKLLLAPAPNADAIWMKWEALDVLIQEEKTIGPMTVDLLLPAVAALKADLLRLGLSEAD
jgi:hypothetical protein